MFITIDDIYTEIIKHLGLTEQLQFRCTNKFHLDRINSDLLIEYKKWKLTYPKDEINFVNAFKNGYLNLAKWLYELGADIHADNDYAFKWSPKHIVDWLKTL